MPSPSSVSAPPELTNHPDYELIKELGQGGMGTVYLAKNRMMDRMEVLKVISKALLDRPGALERFQQEIRSAAKLAHPNIVAAYSVLRPGDLLVFAMEYVRGQDLSQVVKARGPLPVANAAFYIHQVANGLQHAHEKGMVHRDIKPNNLMLAIEGKKHVVKILDFGLAKASSEKGAQSGLTKSGQMLGTPDYVAPEQTLDAHKADIRADIYSLGCTLYFLLSGGPPFQETSLYEILEAHHKRDPKALNLVRPDVPVELATVVAKMMAKDPTKRYQTPIEVAKALVPFFKPGQTAATTPANTGQSHVATDTAQGISVATSPPIVAPPCVPIPVAIAARPVILPSAGDSFEDFSRSIDTERRVAPARRGWWSSLPPWQRMTAIVAAGAAAVLLWGIVFLVQTKDGAIRVEINDSTIEVAIKGTDIVLKQADNGRDIKLSPGEKTLIVERGDFKFETDKLVLKKGETVTVAVTLLDGHIRVKQGKRVIGEGELADGFIRLFNGKDLTGWRAINSHAINWAVEDRVLVGRGQALAGRANFGQLVTEAAGYANFHLRAELLLGEQASSALRFRVGDGDDVTNVDGKGYGVHIEGVDQTRTDKVQLHTGTVRKPGVAAVDDVVLGEAPKLAYARDKWFTLEVVAVRNRFRVKVDGQEIVDCQDPDNSFSSGRIGLVCRPGNVIKFRKIEIRELPPTDNGAAIDLLKQINLEDYTAYGEWRMENGRLVFPLVDGASMPVHNAPPQEYKLTAEVECPRHSGYFAFGIVAGSSQALVSVDGYEKQGSGMALIDGLKYRENGTEMRGTFLVDGGMRNTIECMVTKNGGQQYRVQLTCNGKELVNWAGDPSALSLPPRLEGPEWPKRLFICMGKQSPFVVTRLTLTPLGAAASDGADVWVPLFNGKDKSGWYEPEQNKGTWEVVGGVLVGRGGADESLPTVIASERRDFTDFKIRFEILCPPTDMGQVILRAPAEGGHPDGYDGYRVTLVRGIFASGQPYNAGTINRAVGLPLAWTVPAQSVALPQKSYLVETHVSGSTITSFVEGTQVAEYEDTEQLYASGQIRIVCRYNTELAIRRIELAFPGADPQSRTSDNRSQRDVASATSQPNATVLDIQAAAFRQRAADIAQARHENLLLKADVVENLRQDSTLSDDLKDEAIREAENLEDDSANLNSAAWEIVASRDATPDDYRRAVRWAEAASRIERDDGNVLNTVGVGRYRVGQFEAAMAALSRSVELNADTNGVPHPADVAFLALTHQALGHVADAQSLLQRLRNLAAKAEWQRDAECQAFLAEAEELIGGPAGNPAADKKSDLAEDRDATGRDEDLQTEPQGSDDATPKKRTASKRPDSGHPAKPIDLLKQLNLKQPGTVGDWRIERHRLIFPQVEFASIPVFDPAPEEYKLTAVVECAAHDGGLGLGIVVGASQALVAIDGQGKTGSAMGCIDGAEGKNNATWNPGSSIIDGKPNVIEITVRKNEVRVACNGRRLIDWLGEPSRLSLPAAFAGRHSSSQLFVCLARPSPFSLTKLTLTPLGAAAAARKAARSDRWVPLFNGKDLKNWEAPPENKGTWNIEAGVLVGRGGKQTGWPAHLASKRKDFRDFKLRMEIGNPRISGGAIFVRCHTDGQSMNGYRIALNTTSVGGRPVIAGSINRSIAVPMNRFIDWNVPARNVPLPSDPYVLEIDVAGTTITTLLDGAELARYDDSENHFSSGELRIICNSIAELGIRRIEVKE
ncbi:MAG TPA: family 16 glycoside hydrolase [Pirellulales bacterium]|nr:family 16 glycoside hydrolase [Pirellulales bacterium]